MKVQDISPPKSKRLFDQATRVRAGDITFYVLNRNKELVEVSIADLRVLLDLADLPKQETRP